MIHIEENKLSKLLIKAYEAGWYGSMDCAEEIVGKIVLDFKNENSEPKKSTKKKAKYVPNYASQQQEMDFGESGVDRAVRAGRQLREVQLVESIPRGIGPSRTGVDVGRYILSSFQAPPADAARQTNLYDGGQDQSANNQAHTQALGQVESGIVATQPDPPIQEIVATQLDSARVFDFS